MSTLTDTFIKDSIHNDDQDALSHFKKAWLRSQLKERELEFIDFSNICVSVGTWNVNGKKPTEPLYDWVHHQSLDHPADIIAIGIQELDLSAESVLLREVNSKAQPWEDALNKEVGKSQDSYVMISSKQLGGVFLLVYVNSKHIEYLSNVQITLVATGLLGVMANKGGVGISFKLYESTFCFINAHFNAHQENIQRRNEDYGDIFNGLKFTENNTVISVPEHDVVFWMGDLNYRIDLPDELVRQKIDESNWSYLRNYDQLLGQIEQGNVFESWKESEINFAPTYKFDPGTDVYDTSDKQRIPAWCDRVLWLSKYVEPIEYNSVSNLMSSDHKPVYGDYSISIKSHIQEEKKLVVMREINKQIDKLENEMVPDGKISQRELVFGDIRFDVPVRQFLMIENIGKVPIQWSFIPKPMEETHSKPWLFVTPDKGLLIPGEQVKVTFKIHVTELTANLLNFGKEIIDDILILHFENGGDTFIPISGSYLNSSFGCDISYLIRFPHPIRSGKPLPLSSEGLLQVPKELWRILDWLYHNALDEVDIFRETGNQEEMAQIRECLDVGQNFPDRGYIDPHSMGETLIRFLESLTTPVIPTELYREALDCSSNYSQCRQLISELRDENYNTFYYVVSFLKEVLSHTDRNKLNSQQIALIFSSVLIRTPPKVKVTESTLKKKSNFVLHFLTDPNLSMEND